MSSDAPLSSLLAAAPPSDQRQVLSIAEEVWSIPYLSQRSVMSFLWQDEAVALRAASRACRDAVADHTWEDFHEVHPYSRSRIHGSRLAAWRRCFPNARAANISENMTITDADFVYLKGVRKLNMWYCNQLTITDAAFVHLKGIHTLNMGCCSQSTITDAAFVHLKGIHTLDMAHCYQSTITDAAFVHLEGIHELNMAFCDQPTITDAAFAHLKGIHVLDMELCSQPTITDATLSHLVGIKDLTLYGCNQFTSEAIANLRARGANVKWP